MTTLTFQLFRRLDDQVIRQSLYLCLCAPMHTGTFSNSYALKLVYLPVVNYAKEGAETNGEDLTEMSGETAAR